ncbi:hypothetical protein Y032_0071g605 [Ancylostoma ceylanicum]|uniref:Uncharacterized protein n=1 Tax=Ancylostoma ceylanicum TaxID=53326 RepID=A0A016TWZ5_9BILA|nr:hypothetical protein Y032_0071g605 [Ancylostoma ceylanicum]
MWELHYQCLRNKNCSCNPFFRSATCMSDGVVVLPAATTRTGTGSIPVAKKRIQRRDFARPSNACLNHHQILAKYVYEPLRARRFRGYKLRDTLCLAVSTTISSAHYPSVVRFSRSS